MKAKRDGDGEQRDSMEAGLKMGERTIESKSKSNKSISPAGREPCFHFFSSAFANNARCYDSRLMEFQEFQNGAFKLDRPPYC